MIAGSEKRHVSGAAIDVDGLPDRPSWALLAPAALQHPVNLMGGKQFEEFAVVVTRDAAIGRRR